MNLRDVTAAAADRIRDAAPEFGPLPDALSDEPPTELECQLLKDAGCNLDNMPPRRHGVAVRALRAGHEAGRVSVLQAPDRRDESAGATVPARTCSNMHAPGPDEPVTTLTVEATAPGHTEVQLHIDGSGDVCLDREQAAELIADLHRQYAVIIGAGETGGSRPARSWPDAVSARLPVVIYCGEAHPTLECMSCGREAQHDDLCRGIYPRTGVVRDWYAADAVVDGDDPVDREVLGVRAGADALRGPEGAETGPPGALTPPDPRSPGSADGGGAR